MRAAPGRGQVRAAETQPDPLSSVYADDAVCDRYQRGGRHVPGPLGPARLAVLQHLAAHGEHRVTDLVEQAGLARSTVSDHLACPRDCRLVQTRPDGCVTYYSQARPELIDLLRAAEGLLAAARHTIARVCSPV
ncbi:MAG: ArsR/SmtB family transcription factor [Acidimicrobiales bacterium]